MNNKVTKILVLLATIVAFSPAFAVSDETESRLLEQALVEGAVTKEQKTAINKYFSNIASQKQKEAERYREMADLGRGGKSSSQDLKRKELLRKADVLESEALSYKEMSGSLASLPATK